MQKIALRIGIALSIMAASSFNYAATSKIQKLNVILDATTLSTDSDEISRPLDINDDGISETLNCTYSPSTPPAACGKDDCGYTASDAPTMACSIMTPDNSRINIDYFCSKISLMKEKNHGLHDLLCDVDTILRWNGTRYEG